jgi:hypothetical protein
MSYETEVPFKKGDKVRVLRRVATHSKTTVVTVEKVTPITVGQRVQVNYPQSPKWSGEGVIEKIQTIHEDNRPGFETIYVVKFNRPFGVSSFLSSGGFEKKYITVLGEPIPQPVPTPQPSLPVPTAKPDPFLTLGQSPLQVARNLAVQLAQANPVRRINIDAVQIELAKLGIDSTALGNAAGQIFKGDQFQNTGETVNSTRPGNRGRRVKVWEYVGENSFVVKYSSNGGRTWRRSGNKSLFNGQPLSTIVFSSLKEAEKEAEYQQREILPTYKYRAVPTFSPSTTGQFIVQVADDNQPSGWRRSYNKTTDGQPLTTHVFTTLEAAEKEALRQNAKNKMTYRAVPLA